MDFPAFFDEVLSEERHEEGEFAGRSFPVFAGEAVEGELLQTESRGFFDDGANRADSAAVSFDAGQSFFLCPATVSVHDDRHVFWQAVSIEVEGGQLGVSVGNIF